MDISGSDCEDVNYAGSEQAHVKIPDTIAETVCIIHRLQLYARISAYSFALASFALSSSVMIEPSGGK